MSNKKISYEERRSIINEWIGKKIEWLSKGSKRTGVVKDVMWDEQNDRPGDFLTDSGAVSLLVYHASQ